MGPTDVRRRLLFDVFTDAVFHSFVAALNTVSGPCDEPGRTETDNIFLVFIVLAARDVSRLDERAKRQFLAAFATAAAEDEFPDGHTRGEHEQLGTSSAAAVAARCAGISRSDSQFAACGDGWIPGLLRLLLLFFAL